MLVYQRVPKKNLLNMVMVHSYVSLLRGSDFYIVVSNGWEWLNHVESMNLMIGEIWRFTQLWWLVVVTIP